MLRLVTLGGLSMHQDESETRVDGLGPKALLLLAVLSRCGPNGIPRERLKPLFWPESDAERSAQVLRQTLYAIRRIAGDVVAGSTHLRLDTSRVTVDADRFERLAASEDPEEAIAAYTGTFVDGIAIRGSVELEFWIDRQRLMLEQRFRALLLASARGMDPADVRALPRWIRATGAFPLDPDAAEGRVRAHLAVGDRIGAAQFGAEFQRRLRRELEVDLPPAVARLLEEAHVAHNSTLAHERSLNLGVNGAPPPARVATISANGVSADVGISSGGGRGATETSLSPRHWKRMGGVAGALALAALAWVTDDPRSTLGTVVPSDERQLLVLRTDATPDGALESELAEAVGRLMLLSLDGVPGLRVLDAAASDSVAHAGARKLVTLTQRAQNWSTLATRLTRTSNGLVRIDATLGSTGVADSVETLSVRGHDSALFALVDSLALEVLGRHGMNARSVGLSAGRSTSSLPALRAFLAGERHMRTGRHAAAVEAYQDAVTLDSTFALASYRLGEAADWIGNGDLMMEGIDRAFRFRTRLSAHDRKVVEAGYHWRHGSVDKAEHGLREIVRLYPDDAESWYQLGEVQFHSAPVRGRPMRVAFVPFSEALRLDPSRTESLVHLARIAGAYGQPARVDSLLMVAESMAPPPTIQNLRTFRAFVAKDRKYIDRLVDSLRALGGGNVFTSAVAAAQYGINLDAAERLASLLVRAPQGEGEQRAGVLLLAKILFARGHVDSAMQVLATRRDGGSFWSLGQRVLLLEVPGARVPPISQLSAWRDSLRAWPVPRHSVSGDSNARHDNFELIGPKFADYALGLLSIRLGDTTTAQRAAARLRASDGDADERALADALASALTARVVLARADTATALQLLASINPSVRLYDQAELSSLSRERWLRAQLLEALSRNDEAIDLYESLGQGGVGEIAYIGHALEARARLLRRRPEGDAVRELLARVEEMRSAAAFRQR